MLLLTEKCLQIPYKGTGAVSMPVCAKMERNGLASANQDLYTASQNSRYTHSTS